MGEWLMNSYNIVYRSMKFQHQKKTLRNSIYKKLVEHIPVESSERPRYSQLLLYLFYALDYLILIALIFITKQNYIPPVSSELIYIPFIIIGLLDLFYVKFQFILMLVSKKIMWLIICFVFKPCYNEVGFYVLPISILSWGVWALKI